MIEGPFLIEHDEKEKQKTGIGWIVYYPDGEVAVKCVLKSTAIVFAQSHAVTWIKAIDLLIKTYTERGTLNEYTLEDLMEIGYKLRVGEL